MRAPRRLAHSFITAISAALVLVGPFARAGDAATRLRPPPPPEIVSGFDDGPIDISGGSTFHSLGGLHLGRGNWIVVAKTSIQVAVNFGLIVDCRMVAGARHDATSIFAQPASGAEVYPEVALFALAARFTNQNGGRVHVDCMQNSTTGDAKARFLKITAVRAGQLTIRDLAAGTHTTFGEAGDLPVAIEGFRDGNVAAGAGVLATVASIPLPSGSWSVMAKFNLHTEFTGAPTDLRDATCRLVAPGQSDASSTRMSKDNFSLDRFSFALDVAALGGSGGHARLRCSASGSAGDVKVSGIHLQAIRAGALVRKNLGAPGSTTTGSGFPRIVVGSDPGPTDVPHLMGTVRSLHLTPGSWSVRATASVVNANSHPQIVTCELGLAGDVDRSQVTTFSPGSVASRVPITLTTVHASFPAGGGNAVLRCAHESPSTADGAAKLQDIRIVAVRAGVLANAPLT
jgi:hypothetical protein